MIKQKWIPCSERFPELTIHIDDPSIGEWDNSEPVLVYHNDRKFNGNYIIAQYTNGFADDRYGWTEMETAEELEKVIAWMPLPEPYREKQGVGTNMECGMKDTCTCWCEYPNILLKKWVASKQKEKWKCVENYEYVGTTPYGKTKCRRKDESKMDRGEEQNDE